MVPYCTHYGSILVSFQLAFSRHLTVCLGARQVALNKSISKIKMAFTPHAEPLGAAESPTTMVGQPWVLSGTRFFFC